MLVVQSMLRQTFEVEKVLSAFRWQTPSPQYHSQCYEVTSLTHRPTARQNKQKTVPQHLLSKLPHKGVLLE